MPAVWVLVARVMLAMVAEPFANIDQLGTVPGVNLQKLKERRSSQNRIRLARPDHVRTIGLYFRTRRTVPGTLNPKVL